MEGFGFGFGFGFDFGKFRSNICVALEHTQGLHAEQQGQPAGPILKFVYLT